MEEIPVFEPQPVFRAFDGKDRVNHPGLKRPWAIFPMANGLYGIVHQKSDGVGEVRVVQLTSNGVSSNWILQQRGLHPRSHPVWIPLNSLGDYMAMLISPTNHYEVFRVTLAAQGSTNEIRVSSPGNPGLYDFESVAGAVVDPALGKPLILGRDRGKRPKGVRVEANGDLRTYYGAFNRMAYMSAVTAEATPRGWIWLIDRQNYNLQSDQELVAFAWNPNLGDYQEVFRAPLPIPKKEEPRITKEFYDSRNWGNLAMAVDPSTGYLLVTSSFYSKVYVLHPQSDSGRERVELKYVLNIPHLDRRGHLFSYNRRPFPIAVDPSGILIGDPKLHVLWVLPPLSEIIERETMVDGMPTIFQAIANEGFPPPEATLFRNSLGWRMAGGQVQIWDRAHPGVLRGKVNPDRLRHDKEIPADSIEWFRPDPWSMTPAAESVSMQGQVGDTQVRWSADVTREYRYLQTRLHLAVRYFDSKQGEIDQVFSEEFALPDSSEKPERERRVLLMSQQLGLTGTVEPDGSLRLYLLIQTESGWEPFSWEGRVRERDGRLVLGQVHWHVWEDRYLIRNPVIDEEGQVWGFRWKRYQGNAGKNEVGLVLLKSSLGLAASGGGLEEIEPAVEWARGTIKEILGQALPPEVPTVLGGQLLRRYPLMASIFTGLEEKGIFIDAGDPAKTVAYLITKRDTRDVVFAGLEEEGRFFSRIAWFAGINTRRISLNAAGTGESGSLRRFFLEVFQVAGLGQVIQEARQRFEQALMILAELSSAA